MPNQSELGDYLGEIRHYAGGKIPAGWSTCEGQILNVSQYQDLFNVIGNVFGGDGETTFQLPDLRTVFPTQANTGANTNPSRGGSYEFAQSGGSNTLSITENELPSHSHTISFTTTSGTQPANITGNPSAAITLNGNANEGTSPYPNSATGEINLGMVQQFPPQLNPEIYSSDTPYPIFEGAGLTGTSNLKLDTNAVTLSTAFSGTNIKVDIVPNFLAINYIICIDGIVPPTPGPTPIPSDANGNMQGYMGEIRLFAGEVIPSGWSTCEGQTMQINTNQALFSLLLNTYGGDGRLTFLLPDLRGVFPTFYTASGQPGRGQVYPYGKSGGATSINITANQLPKHSHTLRVASGGSGIAGTVNYTATLLANDQPGESNVYGRTYIGSPADMGPGVHGLFNNSPATLPINIDPVVEITGSNFSFNPGNVTVATAYKGDSAGSTVPFSPKFTALNYIICVQGYYPSFNN